MSHPFLRTLPALVVASAPNSVSIPLVRLAAAFVFAVSLPAVFAPGALAAAKPAAPADYAVPAASDSSPVAELQREAASLVPLMKSKFARRFLKATAQLPHIAPRAMLHDSARTMFWWENEAAALPDSARARLVKRTLDEQFYYTTRYGSPLAYARAFELLADAGLGGPERLRIADYGYGTVGHLRLLASLGADAVGIEVDPMLKKLYSVPGDQGEITGGGSVRLVHGSFPAGPGVAAEVGEGFDLFISKNTLKNGYIHPAQPVNPRMLVHLGVDDTSYVQAIARILKPGGFAMIYNLSPAPAPPDKPYIPWADGRCPFPREMWEAEGFSVIEFDRDDGPAARAIGHALGWDQGSRPMDLEKDLFAHWTLVRKRAK